jgi:uncharacterized protein YybS (DUF2232 family)
MLAAGAASAAFYLSLLSGAVGAFLVAYFAQLPLFLVGLMLGVGPAALAASAAALVTVATGGAVLGLAYALAHAVPAVFMVRQTLLNRTDSTGATEWYPLGRLVGWLCGLGVAAFALVLVLMSGEEGGLEGFISNAVAKMVQGGRDAPTAEAMASAVQGFARFLPGAAIASWIAMTAVNGALAQAIAKRLGRARRPTPEMAQLDLPAWMPGAAAISGIGALMPGTAGFIGANLAIILGLGFVFAGLAVIHARSRTWNQRSWWLVAIYLLSFTQAWPVLIIGLLGVFEPWTNLRGRSAGPPPKS